MPTTVNKLMQMSDIHTIGDFELRSFRLYQMFLMHLPPSTSVTARIKPTTHLRATGISDNPPTNALFRQT